LSIKQNKNKKVSEHLSSERLNLVSTFSTAKRKKEKKKKYIKVRPKNIFSAMTLKHRQGK
jgi:hypothetical protein